jgi:RNA polymerase sigma-70 factor (ECF subfamily)
MWDVMPPPLTAILRTGISGAHAEARDEEVESILQRLSDQASAAWPSLVLNREVFVRHLAARHRDEPLLPWLEATHAADLYLACACARGVPGALEIFEAQLMPKLAGYLTASRHSPASSEDILQGVREKLFVSAADSEPRIAAYSGRGSLINWLRVVTLRTAVDVSRQNGEALADSTLGSSRRPAEGRDPELEYIKDHYRDAFKKAFHDAVSELDPELRTILRLHYVDGTTLEQVSAALGIGRSTVVRRISEARESILEAARRLVRERVAIDPVEFDSILQLLRSKLELSLVRVLQSDDE